MRHRLSQSPWHRLLVAPLLSNGGQRAIGAVWAPGHCLTATFSNRNGSRAYKLYVPTGYAGKPVPLLVMLHGCRQTPDDFAAGTRMNRFAEAHNFLVAYPVQPASANVSRCWNWFQPKHQQRDSGEPSLLAGITRQIMATHAIDPGRVYIAGISAGAAMALIMGETYPDLFSAVGAHSGVAPGAADNLPSAVVTMRGGRRQRLATPRGHADATQVTAGETRRRVPIILFQGGSDTTVNCRNSDQIVEHWIADAQGSARGAPRIKQEHGRVAGGHSYVRSRTEAADGVPVIEQWTVHHLGHAWSGGSATGSFTDPKGPDATAEMVRFFREHPKPLARHRSLMRILARLAGVRPR